jgi:anti-sigma regulatory factor (Ser/Thr protein kinase)
MPEQTVLGALTLPGEARSVREARRFLRELLPAEHPALDDLALAASELVCNAITHTRSGDPGGQVTVVVGRVAAALTLEVTDDGGAGPAGPATRAEDGGEGGRGLRIVEGLAHRWGYRTRGERTTVWAEFGAR